MLIKIVLSVIGIVLLIAGFICLLSGILWGYVRSHTLDGSDSLYEKQKRMQKIHLILGIVMFTLGAFFLIIKILLF